MRDYVRDSLGQFAETPGSSKMNQLIRNLAGVEDFDPSGFDIDAAADSWKASQDAAISEDSARAFKSYLGLGYERMNPFLRGQAPETSDYVKGQIAAIDEGFQDASVSSDHDLVAYRGGIPPDNWAVGDVLEDPAFLSTSWDPDMAQEFGQVVEIRVRAGTRFLLSKRDRELLFARGTRLRVIRNSGGRVVLEIEP